MANLYLNLGVNVADLYKNIDKAQLQQIQDACKDGFTSDELKALEEDGIDVSLIEDNAVEQPLMDIKETDSPELQEAKTQLKDIAQNILTESTKIRELEAEIILLEEEVTTEFENLVEKQKNMEEEQKEEIKEAQIKAQEEYTSSEGKMSKEDYQNNLAGAMNDIDSKYGTEFSAIAKDFVLNNKKSAELNTKIQKQGQMATNIEANKTEVVKLSAKITEMQVAQEAAMAALSGQDNTSNSSNPNSQFFPESIKALGEEYMAIYKHVYEQVSNKSHLEDAVLQAYTTTNEHYSEYITDDPDGEYKYTYAEAYATQYATNQNSDDSVTAGKTAVADAQKNAKEKEEEQEQQA